MPVVIVDATHPAEFEAARDLFREYARGLGVDLCFQSFDAELDALESMYAPPEGALLLLKRGGTFEGCVGLRRLGDHAEMKRLYIRPALRGKGAGRRLVSAICDRARRLGYRRVYLDTLPSMIAARALYADMGFVETKAYYHNPIDGVSYMVKHL